MRGAPSRYGPFVLRSPDTTPEAHAVQMSLYRRLTGGERIALALRLSDDVREVARAGIRARHPAYVRSEVEDALRRMILGDVLFRTAWPGRRLLDP